MRLPHRRPSPFKHSANDAATPGSIKKDTNVRAEAPDHRVTFHGGDLGEALGFPAKRACTPPLRLISFLVIVPHADASVRAPYLTYLTLTMNQVHYFTSRMFGPCSIPLDLTTLWRQSPQSILLFCSKTPQRSAMPVPVNHIEVGERADKPSTHAWCHAGTSNADSIPDHR